MDVSHWGITLTIKRDRADEPASPGTGLAGAERYAAKKPYIYPPVVDNTEGKIWLTTAMLGLFPLL